MVSSPGHNLHQIYAANLSKFDHFVVLDTACQRTCCSSTWFAAWQAYVENLRLRAKLSECHEPFEFGHGPTQFSKQHAYLPVCFDGKSSTCSLLGACIIENSNDIPLLGSNVLLAKKLKATLDLPRQRAYLATFGCEVPIAVINGHLALDIAAFSQHVHAFPCWHQLSTLSNEVDRDPEFLCTSSKSLCTFPAALKQDQAGVQQHAHGLDSSSTTMAPALEELRGDNLQRREDPGTGHGEGVPSETSQQVLAALPGSTPHGGQRDAVHQSDRPLPSRTTAKIGQQVRTVQQVPPVRQEVDLGRRCQGVDRAKSLLKTAAAAFTVLIYGNSVPGQGLHTSCVDGTQDLGLDATSYQGPAFDLINRGGQESSSQTWSQAQEGHSQETEPIHGGRGLGLRLESAGLSAKTSKSASKTGNRIWLTGYLRACRKTYQHEVDAYECLASHHDYKRAGSKVDLMDFLEVFAGTGIVTNLALSFGLSALQPFDLLYGQDLKDPHAVHQLHQAVDQFKPLLTLIAWPCTSWSIFNQNMNYSHRMDELEELRESDRPLVELGCDLAEKQMDEDRLFLGENPLRSAIWEEPHVVRLRNRPDVIEVECDAGAYGAETVTGEPIVKPHRFITQLPYFGSTSFFQAYSRAEDVHHQS